jgi:hypothetical protein
MRSVGSALLASGVADGLVGRDGDRLAENATRVAGETPDAAFGRITEGGGVRDNSGGWLAWRLAPREGGSSGGAAIAREDAGVPVLVGVRVTELVPLGEPVGESVLVAELVTLSESGGAPVAEGDAPAVSEPVGVHESERDGVADGVSVADAVGVGVGVGAGVLLGVGVG